MTIENLINSNQSVPKKWCDIITSPHCTVDCGDLLQIICTSWYNHQVPTLLAMMILIASFIHFIIFISPLLLKCLMKSIRETDFKSECSSSDTLSTEILQPNVASTPISNNLIFSQQQHSPMQKSNIVYKRVEEKSRLLSNELESKANKISAAADALFKSTCLTYINSTCVLDTPMKSKTNSYDSKNFDSLILNYSKAKNVNIKPPDISGLISQAIENMNFDLQKPVKNWHQDFKTVCREHTVQELIRSYLSKSSPNYWIKVDFLDDTFKCGEELHPVEILARQEESKIYEMSESKTQYFNRVYSLCQQIHENNF